MGWIWWSMGSSMRFPRQGRPHRGLLEVLDERRNYCVRRGIAFPCAATTVALVPGRPARGEWADIDLPFRKPVSSPASASVSHRGFKIFSELLP
jgi:hypothetical protein